MEQKPSKRYEITEVNKYYSDRWVLLRQAGSRFDLTDDARKHTFWELYELYRVPPARSSSSYYVCTYCN